MNVEKSGAAQARAAAWETGAIPADDYTEIARSLASPDSPVGIDAKHTHVLILHALDRIERRIAGAPAPASMETVGPTSTAAVRPQVRRLLERSAAFATLSAKQRERLAEAMERLILLAAGGVGQAVEFPGFVADLLEGVFEAVVDASIEQMEAYADLLEDASDAAAEFAKQANSSRVARQRQQLLATMVLLGVNRISVRHRGVRARTVFGTDDDDDD